jgi:hypothetical protein
MLHFGLYFSSVHNSVIVIQFSYVTHDKNLLKPILLGPKRISRN